MAVLNKIIKTGCSENMAFEQKKLKKERMSLCISGKMSFQEEGRTSAKAHGTASQGCLNDNEISVSKMGCGENKKR